MTTKRVVVLGAGPVGLGAALGALRRGHEVTVLEAVSPGASLRRWGPTRFFSPLAMNLPPGAREVIGLDLPDDALLTGPEFADQVLGPLCKVGPLAGKVQLGHRVIAIGREGLCREDYAGHPLRAERAFRLLVDTAEGERTFTADVVLDASGTYANPLPVGQGGLVAPGERALGARILRDLGALHDVASSGSLAGRRVLLVGNGHSAANAAGVFEDLSRTSPQLHVTWVSRSPNLRPCLEVASDPLSERQRVVSRANGLAARPPAWLRMERRAWVEALEPLSGDALRARLSGGRTAEIDLVVSLTGYRPDLTALSGLGVATSPVTEGAAGIARAMANVTDCLCVPRVSPSDLASGEPGFFLVGAKSYGRATTFLLQTGYQQLETILDTIGG